MEISLLKVLLNCISSYLYLSSSDNIKSEPVPKYYHKAEEILKLLKPILDAIIDSEIAVDEGLNKTFEALAQTVDDSRELIENWDPLSSKIYFVLHIESLIFRIRTSGLCVLEQLKASYECLPNELSPISLERCMQKMKPKGYEQLSLLIKEAISDQGENISPGSEILAKIAERLGLKSNQEVLIEAVALEKLKENAEQVETTDEVEYFDQMIALVTNMHECLVMIKQSQSCSPVPIPADFCCPLSLELMTDPVIVASGQTYERAFIKDWIDMGLTVCPKTRQALAHTNLIPNYTVKALIANWCESNNVKLVDPMKPLRFNQALPVTGRTESSGLESPLFAHATRGNRPMSPEPARSRSMGSPGKNSISTGGMHGEGTSPLHPRSTSEGSLTGVIGNGQDLDVTRTSLTQSEDRPGSFDPIDQPSMSPPKKDSSNDIGAERSYNHVRNSSDFNALLDATPKRTSDVKEALQVSANLAGYSSDASGELKAGSDGANSASSQREPELPPWLGESRPRSQPIWRRPSERFVSRPIRSPAVEMRADLSGIEAQVKKLVEDLKSTSLDAQREATAELRQLSKHNMDNRIVIANCGAISLLVGLLQSTDTNIQEDAVTALLNLSINDNNKTAIANADAIEPLIHVLEIGSPEAKENSAATLFSLSVIEENKIKIGRSNAIRPLVDLLGNGTPRGKKDAATALFNLSISHENKNRIVQAGAVKHLVDLMDPAAGMVDKAVAVLANLATIPEGRAAIGQEGGIPVLVEVVELGSARGKENAAAALLHLCTNSSKHCSIVLQEGAVPPLVALSQSGTSRAKEKAQALLSYFRNQRHGNAGRG